jgi:hypothetical protein
MTIVIPAPALQIGGKAVIHNLLYLDSRLRGNDKDVILRQAQDDNFKLRRKSCFEFISIYLIYSFNDFLWFEFW